MNVLCSLCTFFDSFALKVLRLQLLRVNLICSAVFSGVSKSLQVMSVMTGLISILFLFTIVVCIFGTSIIFYRCHRKCKRSEEMEPKHKTDDIKDQSYVSAVFVRNQQTVSGSKGPDIITNTCGELSLYFTHLYFAYVFTKDFHT